jgi:hypothetical protein
MGSPPRGKQQARVIKYQASAILASIISRFWTLGPLSPWKLANILQQRRIRCRGPVQRTYQNLATRAREEQSTRICRVCRLGGSGYLLNRTCWQWTTGRYSDYFRRSVSLGPAFSQYVCKDICRCDKSPQSCQRMRTRTLSLDGSAEQESDDNKATAEKKSSHTGFLARLARAAATAAVRPAASC